MARPQLNCCQATEMIPFAATRQEIQPPPARSVTKAEASTGRSAPFQHPHGL
jgi:hypothetical protein